MFLKKNLEKSFLNKVIMFFLKEDSVKLPGSGDCWCLWEFGAGDFKNGFLSEVFAKGDWLGNLEKEKILFSFSKSKSNTLIRTTLARAGSEIRREFQISAEGINPVSKYWIIEHSIGLYKIQHLHGRNEDAVKYVSKIKKKGGEKIRLPD